MLSLDVLLFGVARNLAGLSSMSDWVVTLLAQYLPYAIVIAALAVVLKAAPWQRRLWLLIATALTAILSRGIIASLFHQFIERPRPFVALGFDPLAAVSEASRLASFPSGHMAFLFAIAFVLFYSNRRVGWWFIGLSLVNGIARIVAGVHYPNDVVGGILIALISALAIHSLIRKFAPKEVRPVVEEKAPPIEPTLEENKPPAL
jgi:undecaprenyl-diphosphatase